MTKQFVNLIPANGWRAVLLDADYGSYEIPLIGWGLRAEDGEVVGLGTLRGGSEIKCISNSSGFVCYLAPDEKLSESAVNRARTHLERQYQQARDEVWAILEPFFAFAEKSPNAMQNRAVKQFYVVWLADERGFSKERFDGNARRFVDLPLREAKEKFRQVGPGTIQVWQTGLRAYLTAQAARPKDFLDRDWKSEE
jgi:hypothetical protein